MKYIALISFSGTISMTKDEVREISDSVLVKDLLRAGYIMEYKAEERNKKKKGESR